MDAISVFNICIPSRSIGYLDLLTCVLDELDEHIIKGMFKR